MKKLRESGYISMAADGIITLNESGLAIAQRVYRRHQYLTRLFVLLGVSEEVAAEDACRIEHAISDESFAAIKRHLEQMRPEVC